MYKAFFLFLCIYTNLAAQEYQTEFFNEAGKVTTQEGSNYFVIGKNVWWLDKNSDTVLSYVDTVRAYYTQSKNLKFIRIYDPKGFQNGAFIEYYPNGKVKKRGTKIDGRNSGFVTDYYSDGTQRSITQFFDEQNDISDWTDTNFKILSYKDTAGNEIVMKGNGYCICQFESGRTEIGKVVDGFRDSIWSEYSKDTLVLQEHYNRGLLVQGVRYYKGSAYKYTALNEPASIVGGPEAMLNFLKKNLRYPLSARRQGIAGTILASFIVKSDSSITNLRIVSGISEDCNKEAVRIVRLLDGQLNPERIRGLPVDSRFVLPIKFTLN